MNALEIPLSPEPQNFGIQLGGTDYNLRLVWNTAALCWMLDIADTDRVPILCGLPVVTGLDLLDQYRYLGFPGSLIVQTDYDADAVPTFENLGLTGRIYFITET
jgi:hypothetical protein